MTAGRRAAVSAALDRLAPRLPGHERGVVIDRAMDSPGLARAAPDAAAWLALVSYARHVFTDYDALLDEGYDRESARHFVAAETGAVLAGWGVTRRLPTADD
jgi:hypothetical protein